MNDFVYNLESLLKDKGISKKEFLTNCGLNKNAFSDWKRRGNLPNAAILSRIAAYLDVSINYLLPSSDDEETFTSFSEKLHFQLNASGKPVKELAHFLGVDQDVVTGWLFDSGDHSYEKYYDQLSNFFEVMPTYWVRPGMISPGMEMTEEEYFLVLLYRDYQKNGVLNEWTYGSLDHYFPGLKMENCITLNANDRNVLSLLHRLPGELQAKCADKLSTYVEGYEDANEAVSSSIYKTGTSNTEI